MRFRLVLLVASLTHVITIESSIGGDISHELDNDPSAAIPPYGALDDSAIDDVSKEIPEIGDTGSIDEDVSYMLPDDDNTAIPPQDSLGDNVLALDDGESLFSPKKIWDGFVRIFFKPGDEPYREPDRQPEPEPKPSHSSPNGPIFCPSDEDNPVSWLGEPTHYTDYASSRPRGIFWNVGRCSNTDWTPEGPCGNMWTIFCCRYVNPAATTPPRPGYHLNGRFCRRPRGYPQGSELQVNPDNKGPTGEGHLPF